MIVNLYYKLTSFFSSFLTHVAHFRDLVSVVNLFRMQPFFFLPSQWKLNLSWRCVCTLSSLSFLSILFTGTFNLLLPTLFFSGFGSWGLIYLIYHEQGSLWVSWTFWGNHAWSAHYTLPWFPGIYSPHYGKNSFILRSSQESAGDMKQSWSSSHEIAPIRSLFFMVLACIEILCQVFRSCKRPIRICFCFRCYSLARFLFLLFRVNLKQKWKDKRGLLSAAFIAPCLERKLTIYDMSNSKSF